MLVKLLSKLKTGLSAIIDAWNPYDPSKLARDGAEPLVLGDGILRRRAVKGFVILFLAFFVWSVTMPLASGVPVMGKVVVAGYRKTVQHSTGGVIEAIMVEEGQKVRAGQVLMKVNPLSTEANLTNYELQYVDLLVSESRLKAEVLGKPTITWARELAAFGNDQHVAESKAVQQELFESRRVGLQSNIAAMEAEISGLQSAITSRRVQLKTLEEEFRNTQELATDGFIPRAQANAVVRTREEQVTALSSAQAQVAKLRAEIAQNRMTFLADVQKSLSEAQKNKDSFATRVDAARFERAQTEIKAPVSGTVVGLTVFTVGGVIRPGENLAQILPIGGTLLTEIKIPPNLIDKVRVGMPADIRFTAFNQTTTPVIDGKVSLVGVDLLTRQDIKDETAPQEFYLAQVEITPEGLRKLDKLQVQPGMPVDVIVKRGERTFMSYFLKPLIDKLALSFRD